jgi:hypothetical protein
LAFDRFKEVALGVERALTRLPAGNIALGELPYVISEVPEPGVAKLLQQFLQHKDALAVASALEVLVDLGDPSAGPAIVRLERDNRTVPLEEDEDGQMAHVTIGELAREAKAILGGHGGRPGQGTRRESRGRH